MKTEKPYRDFTVRARKLATEGWAKLQVTEGPANCFEIRLPGETVTVDMNGARWLRDVNWDASGPERGAALEIAGHRIYSADLLDMEWLYRKVVNHWRDNVQKAGSYRLDCNDVSGSKCAYCLVFNTPAHDMLAPEGYVRCLGCPVYERTGKSGCKGTPWLDLYHELDADEPLDIDWGTVYELCDDMLELLKKWKPRCLVEKEEAAC